MAEWISIEERLPEVGESVEVAIQMKGLLIDSNGLWYIPESKMTIGNISHWRMPDTPKREEPNIDSGRFAEMICEEINRQFRIEFGGMEDLKQVIADALERAMR